MMHAGKPQTSFASDNNLEFLHTDYQSITNVDTSPLEINGLLPKLNPDTLSEDTIQTSQSKQFSVQTTVTVTLFIQ